MAQFSGDRIGLRYVRSKDNARLDISPRTSILVADSADQSIAAGATALVVISVAAISAGSTPLIPPDSNFLVEAVRWRLTASDNSAKIQVVAASIANAGIERELAGNPLPFTFPPLVNSIWDMTGLSAIMQGTQGSVGLSMPGNVWVTNLDGAAAHAVRRTINIIYRVISGCEYSANMAITQDVRVQPPAPPLDFQIKSE